MLLVQHRPDGAFNVPGDFIGFGIESAFLHHYANPFSNNLIDSIAARMSERPVIRVGGTSGDKFIFDPYFKGIVECMPEESNGACEPEPAHNAVFRIGRRYFDAFGSFPNAKMIIQAPLENPADIPFACDFVRRAYKKVGSDRLALIALGNEPVFYNGSATTVHQYVDIALEARDAIVEELRLFPEAAEVFAIGEIPSEAKSGDIGFDVVDILEAPGYSGDKISAATEHYYQDDGKDTSDEAMQRWMNPKSIADRLDNHYLEAIQAARAQGMGYIISEGAATLASPDPEFGGSFAYTMWAAAFSLACMSRGVTGVINLAGRPSARRVFWVPDDSSERNPGPHVRAPFAAAPFVAALIGEKSPAAVAQLDVDSDDGLLDAYGAWNQVSGALERVALLNLRVWKPELGDQRPSAQFNIKVGRSIGTVVVQRLRAEQGVAAMGYDWCLSEVPGCANDHNVTWAGQQWTYAIDQGRGHGEIEEENLWIVDGQVTLTIPDSEAAILFV